MPTYSHNYDASQLFEKENLERMKDDGRNQEKGRRGSLPIKKLSCLTSVSNIESNRVIGNRCKKHYARNRKNEKSQ